MLFELGSLVLKPDQSLKLRVEVLDVRNFVYIGDVEIHYAAVMNERKCLKNLIKGTDVQVLTCNNFENTYFNEEHILPFLETEQMDTLVVRSANIVIGKNLKYCYLETEFINELVHKETWKSPRYVTNTSKRGIEFLSSICPQFVESLEARFGTKFWSDAKNNFMDDHIMECNFVKVAVA